MRRGVFGVLVALGVLGAACTDGGPEESTFRGTGEVGAIEAGAVPAGGETDESIIGALVIDGDLAGLEECAAADDGFRVFVDEDTAFTPAKAKDDLDYYGGATVRVSGRVTKDGEVCTPIADSVADTGPLETDEADGDGRTGPGGAGTADATPKDDDATAPPEPTTSPNDPNDEGSITDPEETTSPGPENP